jgi:BspA type Leucine rich repeat region (6 copies)
MTDSAPASATLVIGIADFAFQNCTALTAVRVPSSITSIRQDAFSDCSKLIGIAVDASNLFYSSVEGVLFARNQTELLQYPGGKTGSYTVPNSVSETYGYAFSGCGRLASVTIPGSVFWIDPWAFFRCTNLASVTIDDGVADIGASAFRGCTSLTTITLPNSVTSIGGTAFADCTSLTNVVIRGSVFMIGDLAFDGCSSLIGVFFEGNAPSHCGILGYGISFTVYYTPGTTGWRPALDGRPTTLWILPNPVILTTAPNFGAGTNGYGFIISWATNASVVVEACADLALPDWSPVGTNTLVDGWSYFSDPQWTNYANRFYRLRSP